jgi:hypothetical protein
LERPPAKKIATISIDHTDNGIDKTAYTFLHPVFQEYFTAQFIDDSRLLFNPNYEDLKDPRAKYYVFELKWRQVFFLWLNRDDIADEEKDVLLKALISVENICGGFYYYQAYFLAAEGLREFKRSRYATEILYQVVLWSFEQFDPFPIEGELTSRLIDQAIKVLYKTDAQQAVSALKVFFEASQSDPYFQCSIALRLGLFQPGKQFAIQQLERFLQSSDPFIHSEAALSLYRLAPDRSGLIDVLSRLLESDYDESIRLCAAALLTEADLPYRKRAIETLHQLFREAEDDEIREAAVEEIWYLEDYSDLTVHSGSLILDLPEQLSDGSVVPLLPSLVSVLEEVRSYPLEAPQAKRAVQTMFSLLFKTDSLTDLLLDKETVIEIIRILKQQCIYGTYGDGVDISEYGKSAASILLQRCAEGVPFSVFYEAWHSGNDCTSG